jgi:PIN domain nuclease of toxin-antitoxin system
MPFVTDTHALVWHMTRDPRLSPAVRRVFESADQGGETVHIPCISLFELVYLAEKKRVSIDLSTLLGRISSSANYPVEPMCAPVITQSEAVPRSSVPDPWDRLIAATSMLLKMPLITRDPALRGLGISTVW